MEEQQYLKIQRWRLVRYCEILLFIRGLFFIGLVLMHVGFGKAIQD